MGKSTPKPPPAPDPGTIINTQAAANKDMANYQSVLNYSNYSGPEGNVSWNQGPSGQWTQNVSLSAPQQQISDLQTQDEAAALNIGRQQAGRVEQALGHGLATPNLSIDVGAPAGLQGGYASGGPIAASYQSGAPAQTRIQAPDRPLAYTTPTNTLRNTYDSGADVQYGIQQPERPLAFTVPTQTLRDDYDPGFSVQHDLGGGNFDQTVKAAQDATYRQAASRLDPQWTQSQEQLQAQLTAQGLSPNSTAWRAAMDDFQRQKTDAYDQAAYSAVQAGLAAQQQGFGQLQAQGQFHNAAQQQQFGQNQQQFQDYNNATLGQFGELLQARQFGNSAVGQDVQQKLAQQQAYNAAQQQRFGQLQSQFQDYNKATLDQFNEDLAARQFGNSAVGQDIQQKLAQAQLYNSGQAQDAALNQQQAAFQNQAQAQATAQNQGAAAFSNTVQQQLYDEQLARQQASNAARQQDFQNQAYVNNQPLNQLSGLLGLGQVSMPTSVQGNTSVAPVDVTGAYGLQQAALNARYQAQMQNYQSGLGGLFSLGSAALNFIP